MLKKRRPNYLIPIAVLLGIGAAIVTSSKVWKVYQGEKATADSMKQELTTLQKSQLDHRASDQMMNPVQKEEEARRMGYAKPDEKPLK